MTRAVRKRLIAAAIAVATGAGIALTAPSSPAVAFFSPPLFLDIRVLSPAHLISGGAALSVPVELTCSGTAEAFVSVTVTEKVGKRLANGSGFADVGCTQSRENILVTVVANQGTSFTKGDAFAEGDIFACAQNFCGQETDQTTIQIAR
jgi:hypothetical protein